MATADLIVGEAYDPNAINGFSTGFLRHEPAVLVQQNIRRPNGNLVPAWETESALPCGTVIALDCVLSYTPTHGIGSGGYYSVQANKGLILVEASG